MRTVYFEVNVPKALITKALRRVWPGVIWSPLSPSRFAVLPEPPLPGPHWIRLRNRQCGICGSDLSLLWVEADPRISLAALPSFPRVYLGHEVVSEVIEIGAGVDTVQVGDRVIMDTRALGPTCLSQEIAPLCRHCKEGLYALCENQAAGTGPTGVGGGWGDGYVAHESEIYKVPDDVSDDQAVLVEPASVALSAVLRRVPECEERVLIIGCGTIGLLTVHVVRIVAPKAHITALARYPHQAAMVRHLGADEVISDGNAYEEIARIIGGQLYRGPLGNRMLLGGYDVVYDIVGTDQTVRDSLRWARARGTVVMVGIPFKLLKTDLNSIWHQEVNLIGSAGHRIEEWDGQRLHAYDLVIRWMRDGALPIDGLITHRFLLEAYKRAVITATDKRSGAIKVTFRM